jgi:hypothetical protein
MHQVTRDSKTPETASSMLILSRKSRRAEEKRKRPVWLSITHNSAPVLWGSLKSVTINFIESLLDWFAWSLAMRR